MAGVSVTTVFDALATTTLSAYRKRIEDNIFDDYPLLSYMNGKLGRVMGVGGGKGSVKKMEEGGVDITEQLMYEMNSTVNSYSGYEQLDVTPQEGMTIAKFNFKEYSGSITISGREQNANRGDARLVNLLEAKIKQCEMSIRDRMNRDAFSDGTGNGSKNLTGLAAMVSASGTYGGLSATTYTWWAAKAGTSSSFSANGISTLRTLVNDCTTGNDKPDIAITTQTVYEYYEATMTDAIRYQSNKVADAGFENLTYKGIPIVFDRDCTSGKLYLLNSKYINFCVSEGADMATTEFQRPINQNATTALILFEGNMTCTNRRKNGLLTVSAA